MRKFFWIFLLCMLPALCAEAALPSGDLGQFEKANIAYREGKFDEAAALYAALSAKYPDKAVFQFNLGNALHRQEKLGPAILAYERALLHAPRNSDVRDNLQYVRKLLEYRIEDKRNELIKVAEKILGYFTFEELAFAALLCGILFFFSWAGVLFFKQDASWGFLRKTLLGIVLIAAAAVSVKSVQMYFFGEAIIVAKEAQVYYGPSVTDQPAFRLGEGLKVYQVDAREGWSRILIASGESGWIQKEAAAAIRESGTV